MGEIATVRVLGNFFRILNCLAFMGGAVLASGASAQERDVMLRDSFPIGDPAGILCQVQDRSSSDETRQNAYDRGWAVVCRDSALPVAHVRAFRQFTGSQAERVAPFREENVTCNADAQPLSDGIVRRFCTIAGSSLGWTQLTASQGKFAFIAEGYSAYEDAAMLALLSVMQGRVAQGTITAASTSVSDPLAFSRVQAESLQPEQALIEGYRRNLGGEYAEAAAYFETLQARAEREGDATIDPSEFYLNRALQKSNLGDFAEAGALFDRARPLSSGKLVGERLQRNFEALNLLNRGRPGLALERLNVPLSMQMVGNAEPAVDFAITKPLSDRLNSASRGGLVPVASDRRLTLQERAEIIDAQALQITGTAQRLLGEYDAARASLNAAELRAMAVRDGRVTTIIRMRSQIRGDLGLLDEIAGDLKSAENNLRAGLDLVQTQYPERTVVSAAEARLAAFLLRNGREAEAVQRYDTLVERSLAKNSGATGFANQLTPYYRYLAEASERDPKAPARFFEAAQLLVRPGVAETQAVLARELSGGSDEAARMFRQSTDLTREIEQQRIRLLRLQRGEPSAEGNVLIAELTDQIARLERQQLRTQAELAAFPQYRMVSNRAIGLSDFQKLLDDGEAYARLAQSGTDLFMVFASRDTAKVWQVPIDQEDLDFYVDMLRASIALEENGQLVTYPFDVEIARELFGALFGPVAGELASVKHLIFEPDGAMLRLPIDLLVMDDASLAAYQQQAGADEYDFTNVAWLGRDRRISTAVSAQGFIDARKSPSSKAENEYLGLGENVPLGEVEASGYRGVVPNGSEECGWNVGNWNRPIDDRELRVARGIIGAGRSQVQTGADFTDTGITGRQDLNQFRILHFATHGLVTPPRPECAAQPALLTSFGTESSDGLLSFDEIFDLNLDADVVILSACDTAAGATIEATRAAGLTTGGGTALDGLVRAFVGAGGRTVLASHWPAPDDFDATERLMSGMFRAGQTAALGDALKASQRMLMDDPATSHPYYWAGFALIGDGSRALLSPGQSPQAASAETANDDAPVQTGSINSAVR